MTHIPRQLWDGYIQRKIIPPELLPATVAAVRKEGKTIATLNGSFDLLHAGHLHIIFEAAKQADLLFVALNTDCSIQQYKSPLRPIISLEHRLQMIAALACVSYVSWFAETDPRRILEIIKPDIHVNGAEYGPQCIEADIVQSSGGKIHIVDLVPGLSTSQILKKIATIQAK